MSIHAGFLKKIIALERSFDFDGSDAVKVFIFYPK